MGKFVVFKGKNDQFRFNLKAGNGEVIATSESYSSLAACRNGIESVRKNALAPVEDQTAGEELKNPKFELYQRPTARTESRPSAGTHLMRKS